MARTFASFPVNDIATFKIKMLNWANRFNICCLLDSHNYNSPYSSYECLLAAGARQVFKPGSDFFASLSLFYNHTPDWIFGHFNYDLKNKIEHLQSLHEDRIGFAEAFLFVPEIVLRLHQHRLSVGGVNINAKAIYDQINDETFLPERSTQKINVKPRIAKEEYLETIKHLKDHIKRGDCYEINYCQEFFAENVYLHPPTLYNKLTAISPNPFSAFYKVDERYLICASPERYIKKEGTQIISQPIKGTTRRSTANEEDNHLKQQLQQSSKERSENVMVVDLVRNDLSKICKEGTVMVQELYGVYSFPQVHQMISTVTGEIKDNLDLSHILKATFPMGSMTGAPKKRVMELIEQYERTRRGIFSGTVGYITPEKDFDFNVVIRSLMYNVSNRYLSYQVGGGITYNSDPQREYQECLLKAEAIKKVLE